MIKQGLEMVTFGGIAAAILAAGFYTADTSGAVSGGVGGEHKATLFAVAPSMAAMVDAWDVSPEVSTASTPLGFNTAQVVTDIALPAQIADSPQITPPTSALINPTFAAPQPLDFIPPTTATPTPPPPPIIQAPKPEPKPKAPEPTPRAPVKVQKTTSTEKSSQGRQGQRAAGAGGGATAGSTPIPSAPAVSSGKSKRLEAAWHARISQRINNRQRYPRGVDVKSATAHVRIRLAPTGHLQSVSISKSSGIAAIDAAAIDAVKRAGRFPAVPKGVTNPTLTFNLPMRFVR